MIPTKDDLIYEVCTALGRSEDDAVLSLVDKLLLMFERQQLLQQTSCTAQLPLPNDEEIATERKDREYQTFQFDIGAAWMRSKVEAIS